MNWFTWQQHKKQFMVLGIFLAIFAAILIPSELILHPVVNHLVSVCSKPNAASDCLQNTVGKFDIVLYFVGTYIARYGMLALPFILGCFWGVPLVANEYINGTNKLIWTRSISRKKWLTVKLLWILIASVAFVAAFTLITMFWSRVSSAIYAVNNINDASAQITDRFSSVTFDTMGFVPAAYALFALTLGVAIGTRFKRILTALALTLGVFLALQIAVPLLLRPHYESPKAVNVQLNDNNYGIVAPIPANIGQAWILNGAVVNNEGQSLSYGNPPAKCSNAIENGNASQAVDCLSRLGYHWRVKYQPAYRYWDFQRIEAALYLVLAVVPVAGTYWMVLKRDA